MFAREDKARRERATTEEDVARARALKKQQEAAELAAEAEKVNGQILRIARGDVLSGLASTARLAEGIGALAERVNEQLKRGTDAAGKVLDIAPKEVLNILRGYATTTKQLVDAAEALVAIERLRANLPGIIVGLQPQAITLEEAEKQVEAASRALGKARDLGLLVAADRERKIVDAVREDEDESRIG